MRAAPVSLPPELKSGICTTSQKLAKLLFEGTRMVTDIQVAADLRETQRRAEQAELKLQR